MLIASLAARLTKSSTAMGIANGLDWIGFFAAIDYLLKSRDNSEYA
jgi:hypothetical protein